MDSMLKSFGPSATDVIRADHARVMAAFHKYSIGAAPAIKRALVGTICIALDAHARMEEEIFYPAMRGLGNSLMDDLTAEHSKMRGLIAALEGVQPDSGQYDSLLMELMREVIHHVAEEETRVLPEAERMLAPQLGELGARMAKRRLELLGPRAGELLRNKAQALPKAGIVAGVLTLVAGGLLAGKAWQRYAKHR
jgi:hypothetical protein